MTLMGWRSIQLVGREVCFSPLVKGARVGRGLWVMRWLTAVVGAVDGGGDLVVAVVGGVQQQVAAFAWLEACETRGPFAVQFASEGELERVARVPGRLAEFARVIAVGEAGAGRGSRRSRRVLQAWWVAVVASHAKPCWSSPMSVRRTSESHANPQASRTASSRRFVPSGRQCAREVAGGR
jgi:hypothetical protein